MRKFIQGVVLALGMGLAAASATAAPAAIGDMQTTVSRDGSLQQVQYGWGGHRCERLRRACVYKHERGESGEGNCRRYREECGERQNRCDRLRRACENKYERGQEGQGNCRRYREECGR